MHLLGSRVQNEIHRGLNLAVQYYSLNLEFQSVYRLMSGILSTFMSGTLTQSSWQHFAIIYPASVAQPTFSIPTLHDENIATRSHNVLS